MGYRYPDPKPREHVLNIAAPHIKMRVTNGTRTMLKVPLWYKVGPLPDHPSWEHKAHHDHRGWPRPGYPDDSCQIVVGNDWEPHLAPIDIIEEGYTEAWTGVTEEARAAGFNVDAGLSDVDLEINVINLWIDVQLEDAFDTPINESFSLFLVTLDPEGVILRSDVVAIYDVTVEPGFYYEDEIVPDGGGELL